MGLFKSLKEKTGRHDSDSHQSQFQSPEFATGSSSSTAGQSGFEHLSTANEKRRLFGGLGSQHNVGTNAAQQQSFEPPPGPPPGHKRQNEEFAPPEGPPPSFYNSQGLGSHITAGGHLSGSNQSYGTDNHSSDNPPPYHDWTSVPDTALLPPPPHFEVETSPTGNASEADAQTALDFCQAHALYTPSRPAPAIYEASQAGIVRPIRPPRWTGTLEVKASGSNGFRTWYGKTKAKCRDCIVLTDLPLWFGQLYKTQTVSMKRTVYFEVRVLKMGRASGGGGGEDECSVALGFAASPYPAWRLPGWERASLGVHGDDGRRFVNDPLGGRDFTAPFRAGETVGIGMTFEKRGDSSRSPPQERALPESVVEVFFTRNGAIDGRWDLHEERNLDAGDVMGLEGDFDLYGAIGVFGGVEFEARFEPASWLYQPQH